MMKNTPPPSDCRFPPSIALWPMLSVPLFWLFLVIGIVKGGDSYYAIADVILWFLAGCINVFTALVMGGTLYGWHITRQAAKPLWGKLLGSIVLFILLGIAYVFTSIMLFLLGKTLFFPSAT